jgi:hypothetical protein
MIKDSSENFIADFVNASLPVIGHATPFLVFGFCLFSYIIGSVFCRKDIKEPDTASAIQTYRKTSAKDRKGLAFNFENSGENPFTPLFGAFMRINFRVDFPYSHLKRYLKTRNYGHLAVHIPWKGSGKKAKQRSKMFINILKARIHRFAPEEMPEIEKNEAHIRLMNSLWYAAKSIRNISGAVLLAGIVGFYVMWRFWGRSFQSLNDLINTNFILGLMFFSVLQLIISYYIRRSIKQYFHYMRVREIMFILEIADIVNRTGDVDMFAGLEPPQKKK